MGTGGSAARDGTEFRFGCVEAKFLGGAPAEVPCLRRAYVDMELRRL